MSDTIEFEPLTGCIGAMVHCAKALNELSDQDIATVARGLSEHLVLVVPEQNLSPAEQVNFGARFGVLEPRHPLHKIADGQEHIMVVENGPERPPDNEDWHADMTYRAAPPRVSILQAKVLPPRGGDTLFSNVHAVYEDLSQAMQRFLQGLTAQHSVATGYRKALVRDPIYEKERLDALEQMDPANSLVVHPVVGHHPVSGRPYLNINQSFTSHVVELTNEESQALLAMLEQRVREPRYQVRHRWSVGDIVMWDNYGAQHYAAGDYSEYRLMHRVTVKYMADGTSPAALSGSGPSARTS